MEGHPQLIPDPEQEQSSFHAVDGALPDDLVEALRVQLAPDLTDSSLTGLTLLKLLVKLFLKRIESSGQCDQIGRFIGLWVTF